MAATVRGLSPEITFVVTDSAPKNAMVVGGVRTDLVGAHDEGGRHEVGGHGAGRSEAAGRPPDDEHAHPRVGVHLGGGERVVAAREEDLRRTEVPRPAVVEVDGAVLVRRRERDAVAHRPAGGVGAPGGDGGDGRIGVRVGRRQRAEGGVDGEVTVEEVDLVEHDRPGRQRAGLVGGEERHAGERLDRLQLLHQDVGPPQPDHRDGLRHAQQEHEPLRHEGHEAGHRPDQRLVERVALAVALGQEQPDRGGHDEPRDDPQDQVDPALELRSGPAERLGLLGQPRRVGLGADRRRPHDAAAGDDEAARQRPVARLLHDRDRPRR